MDLSKDLSQEVAKQNLNISQFNPKSVFLTTRLCFPTLEQKRDLSNKKKQSKKKIKNRKNDSEEFDKLCQGVNRAIPTKSMKVVLVTMVIRYAEITVPGRQK